MNLTPRTPLPLLLLQSRAPRKLWPLEELGGWCWLVPVPGLVVVPGLAVDCNEPHISTEEICLMSDWGHGHWADRAGEER